MNYILTEGSDCPVVQIALVRGESIKIESGSMMFSQGVSKALFGGTGGLFVMETQGTGTVLASAFGDLMPLEVKPGAPVSVDNEHVVAWDTTLDYRIEVASGMFGFTTGEGLVNTFSGAGHVYLQTRNIRSLAHALQPYLPTSGN